MNNDAKILSKILARRMEKVLPSVISQDQTGFIKVRHLSSNLRRLFNVIYSPAKSNTPEILLSLDAEKAFDMIEWNYLFTALEKFGFGPNICAWIKLLYTNPEASVCINNICSDYFKLERGTRQGCPLSPLLFAIAIKPLAVHCRNSYQIKGIVREGLEQKISLYADDMVLYISDPENTVPAVLTALTEFQKISGLRINLNKNTLPFTIADQFKYLGVNITSKHKALYQQNFGMNILPKLLFLFHPSIHFPTHSTITSFIWNSKHPRIRRATLQRPQAEGGMALPNFQFYYWAANIQAIKTWTEINEHTQAWSAIEVKSCSTSLYSLLCSPINESYHKYTNNPIVLYSLRIWNQIRKHFKMENLLSVAPLFGIKMLRDLYIDNIFTSFEQLRSKFNLPATHFFYYLQIRNFVKQKLPDFPHLAPSTMLEKILLNFKETNTISAIYKILLESLPFKEPRRHWEEDLLINISEKEWKVAKQRIHSSSICAKHRIIQLKIIYRAHLSRLKLSKMFPGQDPTCECCNQAPASLGHMFWACTKLTSFWTKIFKCLSDSLGITIPPNPLTAVFGVLPDGLELEKDKQTVVAFTTLLARRLILLNWKNPNSPLIIRGSKTLMRSILLKSFFDSSAALKLSNILTNQSVYSANYNSEENVNSKVERFNTKVRAAVDLVAPEKTVKKSSSIVIPWKTQKVSDLKRTCRRAERKWRKTKLTIHYEILKVKITEYNNTVRLERRCYFSKILNNNASNPRVLFSTIDRLLNQVTQRNAS
uniref:Reverse transcriptase domain-containing protein n=1 Tax=Erpetoichthys calabaricus TaxID=27687 RepID=A0A8C4T7W4_ERPCA